MSVTTHVVVESRVETAGLSADVEYRRRQMGARHAMRLALRWIWLALGLGAAAGWLLAARGAAPVVAGSVGSALAVFALALVFFIDTFWATLQSWN